MASMNSVKHVVLFGGTHGNEMSGVYVAKKFIRDPTDITRKSFRTSVVMANPKAVENCTRYVDVDLNRQFSPENMKGTSTKSTYEAKRVGEIYADLLKDNDGIDVVIDMHNTTANMGNCFIIQDEQQILCLHMINYILKKSTHSAPAHILCIGHPNYSYSCSRILAKHGIGFELGPQPHGVLLADLFQRMQELVINSMEFLEDFNSGVVSELFQTDTYHITEKIDYPRDNDGNIRAMIHPRLQNRDWEALNNGEPMFLTFDGETIPYNGKETVYPVFINEAAYYEKHLAFWLTKKKHIQVEALKVQ